MLWFASFIIIFFFNDTATTEIYTLSLHDALPIYPSIPIGSKPWTLEFSAPADSAHSKSPPRLQTGESERGLSSPQQRSEEHTSELQSPCNLVCRLLLAKNKTSRSTRSSPSDASRS